MTLQKIASNMSALTLASGTTVYFSYKTPVAAFVPGVGYVSTEMKWSSTTSAHITKFYNRECPSASRSTRPQSFFDNLISA